MPKQLHLKTRIEASDARIKSLKSITGVYSREVKRILFKAEERYRRDIIRAIAKHKGICIKDVNIKTKRRT